MSPYMEAYTDDLLALYKCSVTNHGIRQVF